MPVRENGTRQDQFVVRVHLNGQNLGIWDKRSGGALDSDDVKYYPGGGQQPVSLGGKRTTDNVTLQRLYDLKDDHDKLQTLFNAAGKGKVTISQRPLDDDNHEYGKSIVWNGTLKRVLPPEPDGESTSAALVEIEVTIDGYPVTA